MSEPNNDDPSTNSTNKDTDAANEEALAARFAADKERFKMTEEEVDILCRSVRRLFVIEGKMTQKECDEIERQIAVEESQMPAVKMNEKEEGQ